MSKQNDIFLLLQHSQENKILAVNDPSGVATVLNKQNKNKLLFLFVYCIRATVIKTVDHLAIAFHHDALSSGQIGHVSSSLEQMKMKFVHVWMKPHKAMDPA